MGIAELVLSKVEGLNPSYDFDFDNGDRGNDDKDNDNSAWAVRPG
jgi:hypothetical protein